MWTGFVKRYTYTYSVGNAILDVNKAKLSSLCATFGRSEPLNRGYVRQADVTVDKDRRGPRVQVTPREGDAAPAVSLEVGAMVTDGDTVSLGLILRHQAGRARTRGAIHER